MSQEAELSVAVAVVASERLNALRRSAQAALSRRELRQMGDETDDLRYEQISMEISGLVYAALASGAPPQAHASDDDLTLSWPFGLGPTKRSEQHGRDLAARSEWRPADPTADRPAAVLERFKAQMSAWIDGTARKTRPEPLCPSDIGNSILTEGVRSFVPADGEQRPVYVPVTYKDGSVARPLPLRAFPMSEVIPAHVDQRLAVTLLSIRHMEMDAIVDGAWLRNRDISQRRPAGITDQIVYDQSRAQLSDLTQDGTILIEMFQTGLETAIIGFYRAYIEHHLDGGVPVYVQPRYYEGRGEFAPGTPWVVAS